MARAQKSKKEAETERGTIVALLIRIVRGGGGREGEGTGWDSRTRESWGVMKPDESLFSGVAPLRSSAAHQRSAGDD